MQLVESYWLITLRPKRNRAVHGRQVRALCEWNLARGMVVTDDDNIPGTVRSYAEDPCGNRLEFLEARA